MNFRKIFVSIGCCAASVGFGSGKPVQAGDFQSGNEPAAQSHERCVVQIQPGGDAASCERIGGHLRVEVVPRIPDASGIARPGASPVAVRIGDGAGPRGHLRLPNGYYGLDPYRR
ncbi:MAG: hypothetical protein L0Y57_12990 [Beijerinckiaceae bacterium]|nr:hypothetical protein [Beijerinckiaceae bacterium]MCI0599094.1 hypothetical protein [Beijerinckiaceae bacterium]MCI0737051.1 hypothetical protein [Beijerinckiaceae bacterium]